MTPKWETRFRERSCTNTKLGVDPIQPNRIVVHPRNCARRAQLAQASPTHAGSAPIRATIAPEGCGHRSLHSRLWMRQVNYSGATLYREMTLIILPCTVPNTHYR